jgi:L-threonylcarbamoyladenylate synthase
MSAPAPILPAALPEARARAQRALGDGQLVIVPTETVYGLGADATNARAVAGVFAAKGRPAFNPLICHVADLEMARAHGVFDARAERLARAFWPGPLTLVVPRAPGSAICDLATAGLDTVGLRVPAHDATRALIAALGRPLAAPSANPSGRLSPTTAQAAMDGLAHTVACALDGGPCAVGLESTIVGMLGAQCVLLRPGGISREALGQVLGHPVLDPPDDSARPLSPGRLLKHYAPRAPLRLEATSARDGEVFLAFGATATPHAANLSAAGDLIEAAANLFAMLRALDATGAAAIAVAPIPANGLGEAINDRLRRAAASASAITTDETP